MSLVPNVFDHVTQDITFLQASSMLDDDVTQQPNGLHDSCGHCLKLYKTDLRIKIAVVNSPVHSKMGIAISDRPSRTGSTHGR